MYRMYTLATFKVRILNGSVSASLKISLKMKPSVAQFNRTSTKFELFSKFHIIYVNESTLTPIILP